MKIKDLQWRCERCFGIARPREGAVWTSDTKAMDLFRAKSVEVVPWHVTCDECFEAMEHDPHDGIYEIDIEDLRNEYDLHKWESHLNGKNWFDFTDWGAALGHMTVVEYEI